MRLSVVATGGDMQRHTTLSGARAPKGVRLGEGAKLDCVFKDPGPADSDDRVQIWTAHPGD